MRTDPQDEIKAVASATEYTGMLPAIPWDGDTSPQRRMMHVHREPGKVYRKKRSK